jgi:hypothetical protein
MLVKFERLFRIWSKQYSANPLKEFCSLRQAFHRGGRGEHGDRGWVLPGKV